MVVALVFGCLYFLRGPILRQVGRFLAIEEPADAASAVLVFDQRAVLYDEAGRRFGSGSFSRVLFFRLPPMRAEVVGAVPAGHVTSRRQLVQRGVRESALEMLPTSSQRTWDKAAALPGWLAEHPETNVVLLCDRFESRELRTALNRILEAPDRVRVQGVADPRYDETNWWQRKAGTVELFNSYAGLVYLWLNGNAGEVQPDLAPDAYEQAVGAKQ